MRENLELSLKAVFGHEGGLSTDRGDRGNWTSGVIGVGTFKGTKYGIAAHAFPELDIPNLTVEAAAEIYREDYWKPINGDALPSGVDLVVFDSAVNSGVDRATRWLQQAVGAKVDGDIGPETMAAVAKFKPTEIINRVLDLRMSFLRNAKTWARHGVGWTNRVNAIRQQALDMARAEPVDVAADLVALAEWRASAPVGAIDWLKRMPR